ncbi:MAG: hypothetical protein ACREKN_02880 [Longimicrobiaceae bacterium]
MSRTFLDGKLMEWEAYSSGGEHSLPQGARIIFHSLSEPSRRARQLLPGGDDADAAGMVSEVPEEELRKMLARSKELY